MAKNPQYIPFEPFEMPREKYDAEIRPHLEALRKLLEDRGLPYLIAVQSSSIETEAQYEGDINLLCNVHSKNAMAELVCAATILAPPEDQNAMVRMTIDATVSWLSHVRSPVTPDNEPKILLNKDKLNG